MTIIEVPCFYFQFNPFTKIILMPITELPIGTTMMNNIGDVQMGDYLGVTEQDCLDKITELQLTYE